MGLSRRFVNLIVESNKAAAKSLRRIYLKSQQLFYPTPPSPPAAPIRRPITMTESILLPNPILELPDPILEFGAHSSRAADDGCDLACYPFGQRKVLSTDQAGRNLLYDVSSRDVAAMPEFRKPKLINCLSIFVPNGDGEEDHVEEEGEDDHEREEDDHERGGGAGAGSLYVMVRHLREVQTLNIAAGQPSMDFEVLFYGNGRTTSHCKLLPLPPFVLEPMSRYESPEIRSYAIVGGGSQICVSYTLDTVSHTWDKVGDWTLPFHGKVEYVPKHKLWFGLSGDAQHLAAADLSTMDANSPPQLAAGHGWEEFQPPEEWAEQELEIDPEGVQLVNLGSGRFCIARFFCNWVNNDCVLFFVVLTGVEVVSRVLTNGGVKLEMIPHQSVCHYKSPVDGTFIEQLF